jgi:alpha-L-rhamnosidase
MVSCRWYRKIAIAAVLLAVTPRFAAESQSASPDLLYHRWKAKWIACVDSPRREFGVYHFRKTFSLESVPEHLGLHVSGDNRYELFVNGTRVLEGPARGDLNHWRYETLDIAPELRPGRNALAAVVWNFAEDAPMAQMTNETGLIVQAEGTAEGSIDTDGSWKCAPSQARTMLPRDLRKVSGYFAVGPGEQLDASRYPWGWEALDFDDSSWRAATPISYGGPRGIQDSPSRWMLVPRTIPLMEERAERLRRLVRMSGVEANAAFLEGRSPLAIPSDTHATLLFDQTYLTTAYPELVTSGGREAEVTLTYAEALWKDHEKGNRNETEGKEMRGLEDRFLPDGGKLRVFRPLWWRTYRYLQVSIVTRSEPLVLDDLRGMFNAYPFTIHASFASDDPALERMWEVGWRTCRLCAHETYMDCPYYEQLQYVGDTRIQALISLYLTGDDRLVKNAIELLNESRTPEGLTQSRYPSFLPQYIPPFSLLWIGMMRDLWWYRGDDDFLRRFLPGERDVLNWFESRLTPTGLLGRLEWWDFVDWASDFQDGVPPQEGNGQSAILSLQFVMALHDAADLESSLGNKEQATRYRALATRTAAAVRRTCWDPSRHLIADTPARKHFSQHANLLAVLTDALPPAEQSRIMGIVLKDRSLTQCTYYFRYYLFRAMKKAGLGDQYLAELGPWRHMLDLGLTTWAETPEPTRSDCHAWSAHPNFDLLATVAGIESAAPGFRQVAIAPHLDHLKRVEARLPHPLGDISVSYKLQGSRLAADITLPEGLTGRLSWKGKTVPLRSGRQHLAL